MSEINYFKVFLLYKMMWTKLHVGDINWWMMWQLMKWIACMSRELH
jgi:hypothetical protein